MFKKFAFTCLTGLFIASCNSPEENKKLVNARDIIAEVSGEFVPDKRVARFEMEASEQDGNLVVKGESDLPEAVQSLRSRLEQQNIVFIDSIDLLPGKMMDNGSNALVKISVANLRSNPAHSAELATQATLGTPLKVLKEENDWFLVQTPDKYLSWVDGGGLETLSDEEFQNWKNTSKVVFKEPFGFAFEEANTASPVVTDLVAGSVLELQEEQNNFYKVRYPDGVTAYIQKEVAQPYDAWIAQLNPSAENLIKTSRSLMGLPYLWGGTSAKGVDCSGYTKTIFFLNGMIIPRDASQQVHTGTLVDSTRNFENLIPGDLLFFGRPATDTTSEKVVHVGMWVGNDQFIHSSGRVRVSSIDSAARDFDEFNYNRYLRTKRIVSEDDPNIILLENSELYGKKG